MTIREKFIKICDEALKADKFMGHQSCCILEPYFQALVQLAVPDGENQEFKCCLIEVIEGTIEAPEELLPYLVRVFRYQEIVEASERRLGNPPDPQYMNFHSAITAAMNDVVWNDASFFQFIK